MSIKKRKIVFVAPRMHTNEYGVTKFLLSMNYNVSFHVNTIGKTESHDLVNPIVFRSSQISSFLQILFGQGRGDLGLVFPSIFKYFLYSRRDRAEIAFIKNPLRVFSIIALISYKFHGTKIVLYSQSSFHNWSYAKWLIAKIFVHTTNSVWVTPISNNKLSKNYPKRFHYLPFIANGSKHILSRRSDNERIKILMIGKYKSDRKNHKLFLDVLALLSKQYNVYADVVGEVDCDASALKLNSLQEYAHSLGIENKVKFYSNIPFSKMTEVYLDNDIFVLPASQEPAAISPLEAMANGLIAVCSDSCGTKTYIESCFPEFVFKSDSQHDLCKKLELILSCKEQMERYKFRVMECKEEFSEDAYHQALDRIFFNYWGGGLGPFTRGKNNGTN